MILSVAEAAAKIRSGGVVAFPTETVYGLGANAFDAQAVAKIYELKGRPATSPLIVHLASAAMVDQVAAEWPPIAAELAGRWWPGPLTIVVPKKACIPDIVTAGLPTVGLRVPAHPIARQLLEQCGVPVAAPSANRFTQISPTTAEHVRTAFGDEVDIVEGGASQVGIESTVVSIVDGEIRLLRPGMISPGEIRKVEPEAGQPHAAPGMHERHYSPQTPLLLVADKNGLPGREGAYVWHTSNGITARSIRMPSVPEGYAARLYRVLHELDAENWPWIAVETPPATQPWAGIRDRLERAAKR